MAPKPTELAITTLRDNPETAQQFDEFFGVGSSESYLNQGGEPGPDGFVENVIDGAKGLISGPIKAIEATGDLVTDIADSVGLPAGIDISTDGVKFLSKDEMNEAGGDAVFGDTNKSDAVPDAVKPEGVVGGMVEGVTQFLTEFVGVGKLLKPVKAFQSLGTVTKGMVKGAAADFAGFAGNEGRLTDFLNQYPALQPYTLDYLASDKTDSDAEGRFKNALEGFGLGGITEALFKAVRGMKTARTAATEKGTDDANTAVSQAVDEVSESLDVQLGIANDKTAIQEMATPPSVKHTRAQADEASIAAHLKQVRNAGTGRVDVELDLDSDLFNFSKMDGPEAALAIMQATGRAMVPEVDKVIKGGTYSHADVLKDSADTVAEYLEMGTDALLSATAKVAKSQDEALQLLIGGKGVMQSLSREIDTLGMKIDQGLADAGDEVLMLERIGQLTDLEVSLKGIQKGAARTTSAGRIRTFDNITGERLSQADLANILSQHGGSKRVRDIAKRVATTRGSPKGKLALARRGWMDVVNEYYINAILSGPKTHIVNVLSSGVQTVQIPVERMAGGVLQMDADEVAAGARTVAYLGGNFVEAIKGFGKALWNEKNIIDPFSSKIDGVNIHAIDSDADNYMGTGIRLLGKAVRLSSRVLAAEDEFFKQINYRSALRANLIKEANQRFPGATQRHKDSRSAWVAQEFDKGFDPKTGKGVNADALQYAREVTFTQELRQGTFGHSVQTVVNRHPALRQILPFVRTPTNIMRAVVARTPGLNLLQEEFRSNLKSSDPAARSKARGQMAMGGFLWGSAIYNAQAGNLTGGGPSDPQQLKVLRATGWQPYSFVTTGDDGKKVYTAFQRMDPLGMFFGMAADFTEISNQVGEEEADELVVSMMVAFARNITSKSYLTGIIETMDALNNPDRSMGRVLSRYVAGYVPTGLNQVSQLTGATDDPYMREARGFMDSLKKKVPGLSETLAPKVSWLTGEPIAYPQGFMFPTAISPYAQSTDKEDPALTELARLKHGFEAPQRFVGGVELDDHQYAKLLKFHGKVELGGKTMLEAVRSEISTSRYDINREKTPDLPKGSPDGHRLLSIKRIIARYRKKALHELQKSDTALRDQIRGDKKLSRRVGAGRPDAINQLLQDK